MTTIALLVLRTGELKNNMHIFSIVKAPVKFEKDWPKTVGGVAGRRYILPIHFCSIRARKSLI